MTIYSAREPLPEPEPKPCEFPIQVEHKGSRVCVYRITNRETALFTVVYHSCGERQRVSRRDFADAFKLAQEIAMDLANGHADAVTLTGKERFEWERAQATLEPTGLSVDEAAKQLAELLRLLNGEGTPQEAANFFLTHRPKVSSRILVRQAVDEFIASRQWDEVGLLYLRDLRHRLGKFAKAFVVPISFLSPQAVEHYLENLQMSKRSRYNYRWNVGTFLNFAREKGYLPATFTGLKRAPRRTRFIRQIRVFSPADMATLLNAAKPELVSALAITAFAGVRAEEVKRLEWRQVKLEKGYIEIPAAIAKNKIRRFAPITPNLAAWLAPLHQKQGAVCCYKNLCNQYLRLAAKTGVKWLRNGLRHSFVSYRFAAIGNVYQVSNESGHTVKELQTDYLEIVEKELAEKWFSIAPSKAPGKPADTASEGSMENSASANGTSPL